MFFLSSPLPHLPAITSFAIVSFDFLFDDVELEDDVAVLPFNLALTVSANSWNLFCKYLPGQLVAANILCLVKLPFLVPSYFNVKPYLLHMSTHKLTKEFHAASDIGQSPPVELLDTSIVIAWQSFEDELDVHALLFSSTHPTIPPSFPMQ